MICPACEGFGYHEGDGEPECDVCGGVGVPYREAARRWEERQRQAASNDPLRRWVNDVPCGACGAPAGEPCRPLCDLAR